MSGNAYDFLTGVWTNHSTGIWTLTLDRYWGTILTSALVIYLGLFGLPLWCLTKFIAYQSMVRPRARGDLTAKVLVCLRNKSTPFGFAWSVTKLLWHRRRRAKAWTVLPLIILALTVAGALIASRIFVSFIQTHGGTQVRLLPKACGAILFDKSDPWQQEQFRLRQLNAALLAQSRADHCTDAAADSAACDALPLLTSRTKGSDAKCFLADTSLCISTPHLLDSGMLHSSTDLGYNAADADAVYYNRLTTIAPVHTKPFAEVVNMNTTALADDFPLNDTMQLFFVGPLDGGRYSLLNETFAYSTNAPAYQPGYNLEAFSNEAGYLWSPTPTFFNRSDATITLMLLMAGHVGYDGPVTDPWFGASDSYVVQVNESENKTYYSPDFLVTALAFMDQHRLCDAKGNCTPPTSSAQLAGAASLHLDLNPRQLLAVDRINFAISQSAMINFVAGRGGSALLASRTLQASTQIQLPADQWLVEGKNGYAIMLNELQQNMVDQVAGPRDAALDGLVVGFGSAGDEFCTSQLINIAGSGFIAVNFNFTALLILAIGVPVVGLLFYYMDTIVFKIQKKTGNWGEYGRLSWREDELFWLWRNAMAARGVPFEDDDDAEFPNALGPIPEHGRPETPEQIEEDEAAPDVVRAAPADNVQAPLLHVEPDHELAIAPQGEAFKLEPWVSQISVGGASSSRAASSSRGT